MPLLFTPAAAAAAFTAVAGAGFSASAAGSAVILGGLPACTGICTAVTAAPAGSWHHARCGDQNIEARVWVGAL